MESLGQRLQKERQAQGRSLEDIAAQTRISISYLRAIEQNEASAVPGGFFYRSFVRQYAQALGLPANFGQNELEWLAQEQEKAEQQKSSDQPERTYTVPPIPTGPVDPREETRKWMVGVGTLTAVLVICSLAYVFWERARDMMAQQQTAKVSEPQQTAPPAAVPAPVQAAETKPAETAPTTTPSTAPEPPVTEAPKPPVSTVSVQVRIRALEDVWVEVSSGGQRIYSNLVKAGEDKDFESATGLRVRLGNAGGVDLMHNGRPVPAVGPKGGVRTVDFSPTGYEIVAPPAPPSAPPAQPASGAAQA